jgi:tetratricopeptide (TPR) repeat protein
MGEIYFQKGDLDQAIENYEKSLKIVEYDSRYLLVAWVVRNYDCLIKVFLYKGLFEKAKECLERFNQYLQKNKISTDFRGYKLSTARIMRSSSRIRERAEAEKILKEIIAGHKALKVTRHRLPEEFSVALVELCDFYLEELRLTNDLKIIDDIQPLVLRLLKESERTNSYTLQAQSYLLYGIISLLLMNMGDARRYLAKAQQIADSHSLQLLAREISHEHDKLLEQLEGLESYKKKKMTLSERMELASLDETIDLMQGKRSINAPKLTDEKPVLLLILAGGGILLFSYPFSDEVKVEDELFGGFLSAITTFSDEALSEGLDRAKFGQYTVLMKDVADFSFCYLFKGQTYVAQKKLANFTENFQKNTSMMQTLNKFHHKSQIIELKDFPFLEGFIKGIFTNT